MARCNLAFLEVVISMVSPLCTTLMLLPLVLTMDQIQTGLLTHYAPDHKMLDRLTLMIRERSSYNPKEISLIKQTTLNTFQNPKVAVPKKNNLLTQPSPRLELAKLMMNSCKQTLSKSTPHLIQRMRNRARFVPLSTILFNNNPKQLTKDPTFHLLNFQFQVTRLKLQSRPS